MVSQGSGHIEGTATRRRLRARIIVGIALTLVIAAAAAGAVFYKPFGIYSYLRHGALRIAPAPALPRVAPQLAPVPDGIPAPDSAALTAVLAPAVANPALGTFSGAVTDASTGTALWGADPNRPLEPASTTKILTTAAALLSLPADHRLTTRVVRGATPAELVLVGGGDPTITGQQAGKPNIYPGSARLDDLVAQIRAGGVKADSIIVDTSAYTGPTMAPGWSPGDIAGGDIAPMESVMLDGGRLDPLRDESPRSPTPALDVGRVLAQRLGVDLARVHVGRAPADAAQVAAVQSAPLRDRLRQLMVHSDNVLAQAVGNEIAVNAGGPASFAGSVTAVTDILRKSGFDLTGVQLRDTNGLSAEGRIPPRVLNAILSTAAAGPGHSSNFSTALRPMLDDLPVAAGTGTLTDRYVTVNRVGAGWVRAKTGTLTGANGLAGYVVDSAGRVLTFALISNGTPADVSRPALDAVASALRTCGCR